MKRALRFGICLTIAWIFLPGCAEQQPADINEALQSIDEISYREKIKILASDEFQGRAPSSRGEAKTIEYLKSEFEKLGLQPGSSESFFQEVPLMEITTTPEALLNIRGKGKSLGLTLGSDYVAVTRRMVEEVKIENSQLLFAGYGIVAPEYDWNDYENLDARGKTLVVLVNDPGFATGDSLLFNGRAMTYYGRWTYKYEQAARQGAEAVLIVHEREPAGYPWAVVEGGWSGPQFLMEAADRNMSRCKLEGWISAEAAHRLFARAGMDYEEQKKAALQRGFRAQPLGLAYSTVLKNELQPSLSHNVVALWEGGDRKDEYIIYTAHWDHFGVREELEEDKILNGARDNATGTAGLLQLAKAFTRLSEPPRRSILFLAVTAEEQGLLGSAYYAANPIYPLTQTVAVINMDALNIWGKMKDITIIGEGNSELDEYVYAAAEEQGRYVRSDPEPEKGAFYRSDHFSFAREGVPALYTKMGIDHVQKGPDWALEQSRKWTEENYHKPGDEYDPGFWDLSGAIDDIRLLFRVGYRLSMEERFPQWNEGTEFKAKRESREEGKSSK